MDRKLFNLNAANNMMKETEPKEANIQDSLKEEKKEDILESEVQPLIRKLEEESPIKFVKRDKIILSKYYKYNNYPMEDIERLSNSILKYGLFEHLVVEHDLETDTYILISGGLRLRAIDLLFNKFKEWPAEEKENQDFKNYLLYVKPLRKNGIPVYILQEGN